MLPIENMRHPSNTISEIEQAESHMPCPREWIDKENVVSKRNHSIIHYIRIFQVDSAILDVIARVDKELSISVKFKSL